MMIGIRDSSDLPLTLLHNLGMENISLSGKLDANKPSESYLRLTFAVLEVACPYVYSFRCGLLGISVSPTLVLNVTLAPSDVRLWATIDDHSVGTGTPDKPISVSVGQELTLTCSANIGLNKNETEVYWIRWEEANMNQANIWHPQNTQYTFTESDCSYVQNATVSLNTTDVLGRILVACFVQPSHSGVVYLIVGDQDSTETTTVNSTSDQHSTETTTVNSTSAQYPTETTTVNSTSGQDSTETTTVNSTSDQHSTETTTVNSTSAQYPTETTTVNSTSDQHSTETTTVNSTSDQPSTETTTVNLTSDQHSTETTTVNSTSAQHPTETTTVYSTSDQHSTETTTVYSSSDQHSTETTTVYSTSDQHSTETTTTMSTSAQHPAESTMAISTGDQHPTETTTVNSTSAQHSTETTTVNLTSAEHPIVTTTANSTSDQHSTETTTVYSTSDQYPAESTTAISTGDQHPTEATTAISTAQPSATTDIDVCTALAPCYNDGTCENLDGYYRCNCPYGWSGQNCSQDIDECVTLSPCMNNGTCENLNGSYSCICPQGWSGQNCSQDIDVCTALAPCYNDGTCENLDGYYRCNCPNGWSGQNCSQDIDECVTLSPCMNNGTCENLNGSYNCICPQGWSGQNCSQDIDVCTALAPCYNDGTCENLDGYYRCNCPYGWNGQNCNQDIDECVTLSPCMNNGTCENLNGSYSCICPQGWSGQNCSQDIDECSTLAPCYNGGTCENLDGYYRCNCPNGWSGENCSQDIDECTTMAPCYNGGTCENLDGNYRCNCPDGWSGQNCRQDIDECVTLSSCKFNGTCENLNGSYSCICPQGWSGQNCSQDIDECITLDPCFNGGTCVNLDGSYICNCPQGWRGENCSQDIDECATMAPCYNDGTCENLDGYYRCNCPNGWNGQNCSQDIDECTTLAPCYNDGTCENLDGYYRCNCPNGWNGQNCSQDIDECTTLAPCYNGGTCENLDGFYRCNCVQGWSGQNCSQDIDECITLAPCHNGGTCENLDGFYSCNCPQGWSGQNCSQDINECGTQSVCGEDNVCQNLPGSYRCVCATGWTGSNCKTDINECSSSNFCENRGLCYNLIGTFRCICSAGWNGTNCENDVNECSTSSSCDTNAMCSNTPGSFNCFCHSGYIGDGKTCTQRVLLDLPSSATNYLYRGDDTVYGAFYISGGLDYFGKRHNYAYVSMNGYISLGRRISLRNPITSSSSWKNVRYPIIAPLWADIETGGVYGESGLTVYSTTNRYTIQQYFENAFSDDHFKPRFCLVATWKKAVPYPYSSNVKYESADFQVAIATNRSYTYVLFNYDQRNFTWRSSGGRNVIVGYSTSTLSGSIKYSKYSYTRVNKGSNVGLNGRWRYPVSYHTSPVVRANALCLDWYYDSSAQSMLSYARRYIREPCPCTRTQAQRDNRFSYYGYSNGLYLYRSRWTRWPYSSRQLCHYKRHSWSSGFLYRGPYNGGYLLSYDSRIGVPDAYSNCCVRSRKYCSLFYSKNPSDTCTGYRPPSWRPSGGDPHISTIDGAKYTFNGRGEYVLVQHTSENISMIVHVRTELMNEDDTDATIFTGMVAQETEHGVGDRVEVILNKTSNMSDIYINGNLTATFGSDMTQPVSIEGQRVSLFNDSERLVMTFESGASFQVSVHSILDIVSSMPENEEFKGNIRGLLGNNDGDSSNDFVLRNSSVLLNTSSEEELFAFGESWRIQKNESLFDYTLVNKSYEYFNNISIRPHNFLSDMVDGMSGYIEKHCPGSTFTTEDVEVSCGSNVACKVDAIATCDIEFGKASKSNEEEVEAVNVAIGYINNSIQIAFGYYL
ncbi:uncharacterized protein LOC128225887 [Mya arenaria]|uniref:uncharacterized protein LOC128225887 n=1 Tax=Mya arenaria TaxID=6604 RepID=UPI0022E04BA4|nr:uncharacterized protein LOC128225887 [Mya arenaria]